MVHTELARRMQEFHVAPCKITKEHCLYTNSVAIKNYYALSNDTVTHSESHPA